MPFNLYETPSTKIATEDLEEYKVGEQVLTQVGGRWVPAVITKPINPQGNYGVKIKVGNRIMNTVSSPKQLKK